MITENKIVIYEKYNGFLDGYIFENGNIPNAEFEVMDWSLIDELIGNIILLQSGRLSQDFSNQLTLFMKQNTENQFVLDKLEKLARKKSGY